ncbi:MAG: hypothetical protein IKM26_07460 [Clostridia bacterium]|nr:hypothetical protein [Clostridia bacterium]
MKKALCLFICAVLMPLCLAEAEIPDYAFLFWPEEFPHLGQSTDESPFPLRDFSIDESGCPLFSYTLDADSLKLLEEYLLTLEDIPFIQTVSVEPDFLQLLHVENKLGASSEKQVYMDITLQQNETDGTIALTILFREEIIKLDRFIPCKACQQQGTVTCTLCHGTGLNKTFYTKPCSLCDGTGLLPCLDCGSEGIIRY